MKKSILSVLFVGAFLFGSTFAYAADTNTTVIDKSPPTASAPSVVINNNDVCKSAASAAIQTQILGFASGITVTDENCERLKLARSLFGMGMKVAAVSTLCQDARVFDSMWMAGTPCPFMGKKAHTEFGVSGSTSCDCVLGRCVMFQKNCLKFL